MVFANGNIASSHCNFAGEGNVTDETASGVDTCPQEVGHLRVYDVAEGGCSSVTSLLGGEHCTLVHVQLKGVESALYLVGSVGFGVPPRPHDPDGVIPLLWVGPVGVCVSHSLLDGKEVEFGVFWVDVTWK